VQCFSKILQMTGAERSCRPDENEAGFQSRAPIPHSPHSRHEILADATVVMMSPFSASAIRVMLRRSRTAWACVLQVVESAALPAKTSTALGRPQTM